ncbi:MAG: glycoside hydrolase family 3 protein, partial [Nitrospirota bacterium]
MKTRTAARMLIVLLIFAGSFADRIRADDSVTKIVNSLTLEQKVGQLLMVGIPGRSLSEKDVAHLKSIKPGGIVFYGRNFHSASDIRPLISKIEAVLNDQNLPLFFAIDQEGGLVHRVRGEYFNPPSAPAIGAAHSADLAKESGRAVGIALKDLGININLSPVLDVPSDILSSPIPGRCYSDSHETVGLMGVSYIKGLRGAGVLATAKHFPGIGDARDDSHFVLPNVSWKNAQKKDNALLPFKRAVEEGIDAIMVGHVVAEPGDGENPASLSSYWIKKVLREEMGFQGLVIADNIEMKPIQYLMEVGKSAIESVKAGADIVLVSHEKKNQEAVYRSLLNAARSKELSLSRIDEAVERIIRTKKGLTKVRAGDGFSRDLASVSRAIAENSVMAIRRKDAPEMVLGTDKRILYAGYNTNMFEA